MALGPDGKLPQMQRGIDDGIPALKLQHPGDVLVIDPLVRLGEKDVFVVCAFKEGVGNACRVLENLILLSIQRIIHT